MRVDRIPAWRGCSSACRSERRSRANQRLTRRRSAHVPRTLRGQGPPWSLEPSVVDGYASTSVELWTNLSFLRARRTWTVPSSHPASMAHYISRISGFSGDLEGAVATQGNVSIAWHPVRPTRPTSRLIGCMRAISSARRSTAACASQSSTLPACKAARPGRTGGRRCSAREAPRRSAAAGTHP